ncbi:MAG: histidine kinase [Blastocatellia bacterium]|nr:histidine kinase [Blastocatellia bacterium]
MDEDWKIFVAESRRYLPLLPAAPLIAMIPFALNYGYWRQENRLLTGLGISMVYAVVMPLSMWTCYGLTYAARIAIRRRTGDIIRRDLRFHALIGLVALLTGTWVSMRLISRLFNREYESGALLPSLIFGSFALAFFLLYVSYRQAKEESLRLRAETAEARYHMLENQMRPHFLFNALNSLAELIESGQPRAAEVTYKLSDLYRQILANAGGRTASLASEIEIARSYLELEQLRFGSRLRFMIQTPESAGKIHLPSLALQTLVENAVKHGIAPSLEGGEIRVEIARERPDRFSLRVSNTGAAYRPAETGTGIGLKNTVARLDLLYPGRHDFQIRTDEDGWTVASFRFTGENLA